MQNAEYFEHFWPFSSVDFQLMTRARRRRFQSGYFPARLIIGLSPMLFRRVQPSLKHVKSGDTRIRRNNARRMPARLFRRGELYNNFSPRAIAMTHSSRRLPRSQHRRCSCYRHTSRMYRPSFAIYGIRRRRLHHITFPHDMPSLAFIVDGKHCGFGCL